MKPPSYIAGLLLFSTLTLTSSATDINVGRSTLNWNVTSVQDSTGPAHRKINLAGRPMPDVAPPEKEQTDEKAEEPAYVDAFTQRLQYSTWKPCCKSRVVPAFPVGR
jgi:hypothetical protein